MLASRSHGKNAKRVRREYLLHGKAFCVRCGARLAVEAVRSRIGATHFYYTCSKRKNTTHALSLLVNSVYVYDDKIVMYFNLSDTRKQVSYIETCDELEDLTPLDGAQKGMRHEARLCSDSEYLTPRGFCATLTPTQ
jgi:ribosomal protein L40E